MFSKVTQMKASSLCAASAFLVLGGFMAVNLAGCGGGGGGGGFNQPTPTTGPQSVTFRLQLQNGSASNRGTVSITGPVSATAQADANGVATIPALTPGRYTVTFTVFDESGAQLSTTTNTIDVTRASGQTFLLIQDNTTPGSLTIRGVVRLNPLSDDPNNNPSRCTPESLPITGNFLVSVIDLDNSKGQPIIAQVRRSAQPANTLPQNRGTFTIAVPYRPQAFRIQVSQYDVSGARYAGLSAATNFSSSATEVTGVTVCVNTNGAAPTPAPTLSPTFTPSPTPGITPRVTPGVTPIVTNP